MFEWPAGPEQARARRQAAWHEAQRHFPRRPDFDAFVNWVVTSASDRWTFTSAGKTGTTAALEMLFRYEFGVPLTVRLDDPSNINPDQAAHVLIRSGAFRLLTARADVEDYLGYIGRTVRVATCRHPRMRAWSAFRYLCRSDALAHPWFVGDRIRLTATTGFDWTAHPGTRAGFERFLDYVALSLAEPKGALPNNHWRPQVIDTRPDAFPIGILGRVEDMGAFSRALAEMMDRPPLEEVPTRNAGGTEAAPDWLREASVLRRLADVYAADYEAFGYDD